MQIVQKTKRFKDRNKCKECKDFKACKNARNAKNAMILQNSKIAKMHRVQKSKKNAKNATNAKNAKIAENSGVKFRTSQNVQNLGLFEKIDGFFEKKTWFSLKFLKVAKSM